MSINSNKAEGVRGEVTQLRRIADILDEILRLVKKDMEPRTKEKDEVYIETLNGPELREKN